MPRRNEEPRRVDAPLPGFFLFEAQPERVRVPARIDLVRGMWTCEIDGQQTGPPAMDPVLVPRLFEVWHWGFIITADTYIETTLKRSRRLFCFPQAGKPSNWYA